MLYLVRLSHDHYIDSQAEVEHHSMTGKWEGYMMLYRVRQGHDNYIDAQAEVEHHSMTGVWEVYMGRHLASIFIDSNPQSIYDALLGST